MKTHSVDRSITLAYLHKHLTQIMHEIIRTGIPKRMRFDHQEVTIIPNKKKRTPKKKSIFDNFTPPTNQMSKEELEALVDFKVWEWDENAPLYKE